MNQSMIPNLAGIMPAAVATGLFVSVASFFDRIGGDTPQQDSMGQVDQTLVPVAGLQNITAMFGVARNSPAFLPDEGMRLPTNTLEEPEYHLLLDKYYPAVLPRFLVQITGDPATYEITPGTVQSDSQSTQTRLKLRRFSF
jgi:hypothetical protein